jgi:hypothetical protein
MFLVSRSGEFSDEDGFEETPLPFGGEFNPYLKDNKYIKMCIKTIQHQIAIIYIDNIH